MPVCLPKLSEMNANLTHLHKKELVWGEGQIFLAVNCQAAISSIFQFHLILQGYIGYLISIA